MTDVSNYSKPDSASISYTKRESCTDQVVKFVEDLHTMIPTLIKEFKDLQQKAEFKPCKAFDDKMGGISAICKAEKDLDYWYVENKKRYSNV